MTRHGNADAGNQSLPILIMSMANMTPSVILNGVTAEGALPTSLQALVKEMVD